MKTIFMVDDNDANLLLAKNALDGIYETYAMPSAARLFKLIEKITPDLILLDVNMPEMDGFETIQRLKADQKLKTIPVVFLTWKEDPESEKRGFDLGALDFIRKPFSAPLLTERIKALIGSD